MSHRVRVALAVVLAIVMLPTLAGAEEAKPIQLYNGKDLTGWTFTLNDKSAKMADVWTVSDDGVLHCKGQPIGYIRTEAKYTSYKLKVEWRCPGKPGNSGVLLRVQEPDQVWPKSIECQLNSNDAGDIWNIDKFRMTVDPARTKDRRTIKLHSSSEKPLGEWNTYEITMDGSELELKVNGVVQNTATTVQIVAGSIALQSEGVPIEFRKVELTPLPDKGTANSPRKLFNGTDLDGWESFSKDGTKTEETWQVKDGVIHSTGKPNGYLKTKQTYKDFILKLDYRWDGKAGNGGIFVRATPPDMLWPKGLQAQLQDQNSGDLVPMGDFHIDVAPDRLKKKIQQTKLQPFNEKPVGEWNTYEIKVQGDTIELKIDGVLQNATTGVEQVAGFIALQAEGTPTDFRNIELTPLGSEGGKWSRLPGLEGWHVIGNGNWTFHDGIIEGQQTKEEKTYTHVVSDKRYKNLRATLMYKCLDGNSGFYVRAQPNEEGHMYGIQCEIDVKNDAGGFYESYGRNWVSQPKPQDVAKYYKPMEWNKMKVEAQGNHLIAWINGTKAAEITDDKQRMEGVCALQIHGGQNVHVMFKDIKIEELPE
jgi:hypothetical protein